MVVGRKKTTMYSLMSVFSSLGAKGGKSVDTMRKKGRKGRQRGGLIALLRLYCP